MNTQTFTCEYCQKQHTNESSRTCEDCDHDREHGGEVTLNECLGCEEFYVDVGRGEYCDECNADVASKEKGVIE
jgi:hypothetical protein